MLEYWDINGYPDLRRGSAYGLIDDLADQMNYVYSEGVLPDDIATGLERYCNRERGYSFSVSMSSGISQRRFQKEIDEGRPFVYGSYDNPWGGGHAVAAVGYSGDYIVVHDNWPSTPCDYNVAWDSVGHSDDMMIKLDPGAGGGSGSRSGNAKVKQPNAGDRFESGDKIRVKWENVSGSSVTIELYDGNTFSEEIAYAVRNDGKYKWKVPDYIGGSDDYKVVILAEDGNAEASSESFSIDSGGDGGGRGSNRSAAVTKPKAYDLLWVGDETKIKWRGLSGSSVRIDLYNGYYFERTIKSSTGNDGSYCWDIPENLYASFFYYVVVTDEYGQQAVSDYFTIW